MFVNIKVITSKTQVKMFVNIKVITSKT